MKDGTVGWNPGKKNPNVIKPAGTIDPDVPVVFLRIDRPKTTCGVCQLRRSPRQRGRTFDLGRHAGNAEPLPGRLQADRIWSPCLPPVVVAMSITSTSIGPRPQRGFGNAARMGTILAAEVLRIVAAPATGRTQALRVKSEIVRLALPDLASGDEEKSRAIMSRVADQKSPRPGFMEMVEAFKVRDVMARQGRPQEVEVQVIALGNDVAWVSLPGEIFTELGLAIKQDSPFPHTIVAELANGSIGYIPSRRAYPQGNYEVVSARCAAGSGERLVDTAVKLLTELHSVRAAGNVH